MYRKSIEFCMGSTIGYLSVRVEFGHSTLRSFSSPQRLLLPLQVCQLCCSSKPANRTSLYVLDPPFAKAPDLPASRSCCPSMRPKNSISFGSCGVANGEYAIVVNAAVIKGPVQRDGIGSGVMTYARGEEVLSTQSVQRTCRVSRIAAFEWISRTVSVDFV
jgi:hypothetical protein